MKNGRKIIKNCLIIILIILLIILLKDIYRQISFMLEWGYKFVLSDNEKLDTTNPMTLDQILELLEKGTNYDNYVITKKYKSIDYDGKCSDIYIGKIYVKDNLVKLVTNENKLYWSDYDKNLSILTDDFVGAYFIPIYEKDINKEEYFDKQNKQKVTRYGSLINDDPTLIIMPPPELKFEYLGEKEINGRKTIVVKNIEVKHGNYEKYYIDKETGVIVNKEEFNYIDFYLFNYIFSIPILCQNIDNSLGYQLDSRIQFFSRI